LRVLPSSVFHSTRPFDVRPSMTIAAFEGEGEHVVLGQTEVDSIRARRSL
jgi:hypothetical protein